MTGIETALLGASLGSAVGGGAASAVGLLGAAGTFAPMAGSLAAGLGSIGTLGTIASLGSTFLGMQGQKQQQKAEAVSNRTNAAIEATNSANQEIATRRDQYLRTGANVAAAGAGGGQTGSALDILADNAAQDELNIIGIRKNATITQDVYKSKASSAKQAGKMNTYAGILSGGVDAYKLYKGL